MLRYSLPFFALLAACAAPPQNDGGNVVAQAPESTESKSPDSTSSESSSSGDAAAKPATAQVGQPAPDFTLTDLEGKEVKLSSFKGKTVVLEWFNPGCPFVVQAHEAGPLKDMASTYAAKDVVWLAVNSGAPGKQGHGAETNREWAEKWSMKHPVLLDEAGTVGRMYDAKTTPEMYVIDAEGVLRYHGALDNAPRGEVKGASHQMLTGNAIDAILDGKDVPNARNRSYGCSVKYAS